MKNITLEVTYNINNEVLPTISKIKKDIKKGLEANENTLYIVVDYGQLSPISKGENTEKGGLQYIKQANKYRKAIESNGKYKALQFDYQHNKHAFLDTETNISYYFNNLEVAYHVLVNNEQREQKVKLKDIKSMVGYEEYSSDHLNEIMELEYDKYIYSKSKDFYSIGTNGINGLCGTVIMKDGTVHKIKIVGRKTSVLWF